jgi:hypothetical protein
VGQKWTSSTWRLAVRACSGATTEVIRKQFWAFLPQQP